jgi:hypothetical protein
MAQIAETYQRFMECSDRNALLVDLRTFQEEAQVLRDTIHRIQGRFGRELDESDLQPLRLHAMGETEQAVVDDCFIDKGLRLEMATMLEAKILAETKSISKIRILDNRIYEIHRQSIFTDLSTRGQQLDQLYLELDACSGQHSQP